MRILEFFAALKREKSPNEVEGKFIGARLDRASEDKLIQWMKDNGIKSPTPKASLHITVIISNKDFPWEDMTYSPKLEINPSSYKLAKFGEDKDILVLKFDQPDLEKRHHSAKEEHKIDWDFSVYEPHITISDNPDNDIDRILLPTFPMFISHEYNNPNPNESVGMIGLDFRGGYGATADDPEKTPFDGEDLDWIDPGSNTQ